MLPVWGEMNLAWCSAHNHATARASQRQPSTTSMNGQERSAEVDLLGRHDAWMERVLVTDEMNPAQGASRVPDGRGHREITFAVSLKFSETDVRYQAGLLKSRDDVVDNVAHRAAERRKAYPVRRSRRLPHIGRSSSHDRDTRGSGDRSSAPPVHIAVAGCRTAGWSQGPCPCRKPHTSGQDARIGCPTVNPIRLASDSESGNAFARWLIFAD